MKNAEKKMQIYCGPDISGIARQYDVFVDGLPERLVQLAQEHPAVGALIVPVKDAAEMRLALQKPGSAKHNIFMKAKKEIEGV